jgi:hypothetical protein
MYETLGSISSTGKKERMGGKEDGRKRTIDNA